MITTRQIRKFKFSSTSEKNSVGILGHSVGVTIPGFELQGQFSGLILSRFCRDGVHKAVVNKRINS
jgi:hypothetical protein